MKKVTALCTLIFVIILLCACTPEQQAAVSSATPPPATEQPSPTPAGVEKVFGKQVKIAVISNGDEAASALFFAAAKAEAESMGVQAYTAAAGKEFDNAVAKSAGEGAAAIIAYLPNKAESYAALESAAQKGTSVSIFEMQKGDAPAALSQTYFNPGKQVELALEATLAYPPHDTPVRLIALFESKGGQAATAYETLKSAGKVFPKETYVAEGNKTDAKAWLEGKLKSYPAGTIDAIFAEDETLALAALDTLEAGKRTDMEVFTIGLSGQVLTRMQGNPDIFAQAAGANSAYAGKLNVRIALSMIKGHAPVKEELAPMVADAKNLKDKDAAAALADMVTADEAGKYNETWMDELRGEYSK